MTTTINHRLTEFGFSQYEIGCYLNLVTHNPLNGSQLSRLSGVSRSKIYDVLSNMINKGVVVEIENGLYIPLPPEELFKRLRNRFENNMELFKEQIKKTTSENAYEFVWTIKGYTEVMAKARELIESAEKEIYIRLAPTESRLVDDALHDAEDRGIAIKYICLGRPTSEFPIQVIHPEIEELIEIILGRPINIIVDGREALVGRFETGDEDNSPINWTQNHWLVVSSRDSIRHDFFHYFFHKVYELGQQLSENDKRIYESIKRDNSWIRR